ncbi:MAG: hypothetical protein WDN69_27925 [Aliidongia sp.]
MLLALIALPGAILIQWRRPGGPDRTRSLQILLIATAILFPGLLRGGDQGRAVRRHAPFHLRAAADRALRGAGRRPAVRAAAAFPLPPVPSRSLGLYGIGHVHHHGAAAPRRIRLLQRLRRRREGRGDAIQDRLLG